MRFLGRINEFAERQRIRDLLESRGIPVFEQQGRWTPAGRALFVCINEQYDDAVALLANADHEVRDPVDIEQFEKAERTTGLQQTLNYALLALLAVALMWAAVVAVAWWQGKPIFIRG